MACCGEDYVNGSRTVCCRGHEGVFLTHHVGNINGSVKCCGSDLILQEEQCCNGEDCRPSALCPISSAAGAYCGTCSFNPTVSICTWVRDLALPPPTPAPPPPVPAASRKRLYTDLDPHTSYEYRVAAWNGFGRGFSPFSRVTTKEDVPWGVRTPRWRRVGDRSDIIQLDWQAPTRPNGEISHYVVLRDGQERYTGTESGFTDMGGIRPFQEYVYQLRACTSVGCSDSDKVVAVTVQGVPENVPSPVVSALGPRALQLSWGPPTKPNGIVREYRVNQSGAGVIFTGNGGASRHTLTVAININEERRNPVFCRRWAQAGGAQENSDRRPAIQQKARCRAYRSSQRTY
ncbi:hypothetical protein JZ751_002626 [Albula glossodonta]|uniref:Fibronectin type-III domain-containing protein n=1 Tax=Albula glossodonta TaxID=121402 RepID=A0A8T2N7E0_9TELE|nr:hypothetical protein JZ751_002626 [Albula glossodonta]